MIVRLIPARGSTSALHITHDDGRVECFAPYRNENVKACLELGPARVLLGIEGNENSLVLYDIATRAELRRLDLETRAGFELVRIGPDAVLVIGAVSVQIVDPRTLELVSVRRAILIDPDRRAALVEEKRAELAAGWQQHRLRRMDVKVQADGRIAFSWRDSLDGDWIGVAHLDPVTLIGPAEIPRPPDEPPGALRRPGQISPSGSYALRRHYATLPIKEGASDGEARYGLSMELWSSTGGPHMFERTLFVRWISVADIETAFSGRIYRNVKNENGVGLKAFEELVEASRAGEMTFHHEARPRPRTYADQQANQQHQPTRMTAVLDMMQEIFAGVLWEPNECGFWVLSSATHKDSRGGLRRVGLDGSLSATIRLERHGLPTFFNPMEMRWHADGKIALSSSSHHMFVDPRLVAGRDPDEVVTLDTDADGFDRSVPEPDKIEYVESGVAQQTILFGGWDAPSVIAAIEEMTQRIRDQYEDLLIGEDDFRIMAVSFTSPEETFDEAAFFAAVAERNVTAAAPALRALIAAYCDKRQAEGAGLEETDPDHRPSPLLDEDGTSALAPALSALLMLSPGEVDLFLAYSLSRPRGGYDETEVLRELCARHPLSDEAGLRMAVIAVFSMLHKGGGPESWRNFGLLQSAPDILKPRAFANLLRREMEREAPDPRDREIYYAKGLLAELEAGPDTGEGRQPSAYETRTAQWLRGSAQASFGGRLQALRGW